MAKDGIAEPGATKMPRANYGLAVVLIGLLTSFASSGAPVSPVASFPGDGSHGVVAWADDSQVTSHVEAFVNRVQTSAWQVDGFSIKGIDYLNEGTELLAVYGVVTVGEGEGRWVGRVYEMSATALSLQWSTEDVNTGAADPEIIRISRDGESWLMGWSDSGGALTLWVGQVGGSSPTWVLAAVPPGRSGVDELVSADILSIWGHDVVVVAWRGALFHATVGDSDLASLALPANCGDIVAFEMGGDTLWARCNGQFAPLGEASSSAEVSDWLKVAARAPARYVAYPFGPSLASPPPVSMDSKALGVSAASEVHALADGKGLLLDRQAGTVARVGISEGALLIEATASVPQGSEWAGGAFLQFPQGEASSPQVTPWGDIF